MLRATRRLVAAALLVALTGCTGSTSAEPTPTGGADVGVPRGGTLRAAMSGLRAQLDPQRAYDSDEWELFRCCLLRTLLSYNGKPSSEGGSIVRPDLAAEMPRVSADGLTWTFRVKEGIHYAPPLQDVEIVAQDVVRALMRAARPTVTRMRSVSVTGGYPSYYSVIEGFDDFRAGRSGAISGLAVPDEHTLIVRTTEPVGDLGYRLSQPAAAPIPPNPADPGAPLGVAEGHDRGYGRYLVSSGPYMIEGSQALDFTVPPGKQDPVGGYTLPRWRRGRLVVRETLTLVRNPSWDASTDGLRDAYADSIWLGGEPPTPVPLEVKIVRAMRAVDVGRLDLFFNMQPPARQVRRYRASPDLRGRAFVGPVGRIIYATVNVAVPPFDDPHVRRAVSYAIDREALAALWHGAGQSGEVASHLAADGTENDLLADASWTIGDLDAARQEMRQATRYDTDGDGRCDVPTCRGVSAAMRNWAALDIWPTGNPWPAIGDSVSRDLRRIGIQLDLRTFNDEDRFWAALGAPERKVAVGLNAGWQSDFPNASGVFPALFGGDCAGPACYNFSRLGASPEQLGSWGYRVTEVPSADARIEACLPLVGQDQFECWADLDRYLTQDVVPAVPYLALTPVRVVSARVASFSWDELTALPALDRIALVPGSK